MGASQAAVFVVDQDAGIRASLGAALSAAGLAVEHFCSADEFLERFDAERSGCIVLDIRCAGVSGPALQRELASRRALAPVVFITGHGDVPLAVEAMRFGAVEFLQKPFTGRELIERIGAALERDRLARAALEQHDEIRQHLDALSPHEREVLKCLQAGKDDAEIGATLNLSLAGVEHHRAQLLDKMRACSCAHAVMMALVVEQGS
jgi:two-component system response regulator FixJ